MSQSSINYRAIFEHAGAALFICDKRGQIVEANPRACRQLGYSRDELIAMTLVQVDTQDENPHASERISAVLAQGQVMFETVHRHKDTSPVLVEVSASSISWDGQPAVLSICRPIEELTQEKALLRESEARLRAITDSSNDAILMMNPQGRISYWNPAAERIFGYASAEALGADLHHLLVPTRYHQAQTQAFQRFQQTGEGGAVDKTLELAACHRDGYEIAIELSLSRLHVMGAWHAIGMIRDITERKKAETELRESEERFRVLHDASFGGIFVHDQGVILDCNQGLSTITGYSTEELIGMDGLDLIAPAWRSVVLENISSGYGEPYDVDGMRKDGAIYPLCVRGSNIPYKGRVARVAEFRDISERKRAEEERKQLQMQLVQAQKMEAIGTLAGGIAHDFNNILAAILGYVELSRDVTAATSPAIRFLDKALEGIHRATMLVRQILAFSRHSKSERVALQIVPIIKEAVKLLRPLLPSTISIGHQLEINTRAILADPTQIHQIVMNLCTNAFHAMEETGGTLTITLKNLELSPEDLPLAAAVLPGHFIVMSVGDTGPGIAPEIRDRIFDPYFTTKEVGKGSGIGLALVHGIVKNYGGFITVDSEAGAGALFHVHLPAVEQADALAVQENQPVIGGNERVLLVDDEEMLADMNRSMLEHLGYTVTIETDSQKAWELFREGPEQFDVVITDQTMPNLTGIDLARQMLALRPDLPIILCTGYSSIVSEEKAKKAGIKGFAMKPLALKNIAALIRRVVDDCNASA